MALIQIELSEIFDGNNLEEAVLEHLKSKGVAILTEVLQQKIDNMAVDLIEKAIDEEIGEVIKAKLNELVENGWVKTDGYGFTKNEKVVSIATRLNETLQDKHYSRNGFEGLTKDIIERKVVEWLGEMSVKQRLALMVDDVMKAKLAEVLKQSLGLK